MKPKEMGSLCLIEIFLRKYFWTWVDLGFMNLHSLEEEVLFKKRIKNYVDQTW